MEIVKPQLDFYGSAPIPRVDWREQGNSRFQTRIGWKRESAICTRDLPLFHNPQSRKCVLDDLRFASNSISSTIQ